jgi:hypothetical protein
LKILQSSTAAVDVVAEKVRRKDDWSEEDEYKIKEYVDSIEDVLYQDAEFRQLFVKKVQGIDSELLEAADGISTFQEALYYLTEGTEEQSREIMR